MAWVSDTVFSALVLASAVFGASTIGFAVAWVRARERAIRAEHSTTLVPGGGEVRLDRLEHAVEAIAVEVEQMSEGQRFVSSLLAKRVEQERDASAHPARVTTA